MSLLSAAFLSLSLLYSLHPCKAAVFYVKPTWSHNATCPSDHPCLTLNEYANNSTRYFTSDTVFLLLSGHHELDISFDISSINNLTLKPFEDSGSVVIHAINSTIRFVHATEAAIIALTFQTTDVYPRAPIFPSTNPLIIMIESTTLLITDSIFKLHQQSGIRSENSKLSISGNTAFFNNTADSGGSALVFGGTSIILLTGNITFQGNGGYEGGAIVLTGHSMLCAQGNITFLSNYASKGGAIGLNGDSSVTLNGNVTFTRNRANGEGGGAICCTEESTIVLKGNVMFSLNYASLGDGGAIALSDNAKVIIQGQVTFGNNSATNNGGAIALKGNRTIALPIPELTNITFTNNTAKETGGAIYFPPSTTIYSTPHCVLSLEYYPAGIPLLNFIHNKANRGGDAIYGAMFAAAFCTMPSGIPWSNPSGTLLNCSLFSPTFNEDASLISSNPYTICFCEGGSYTSCSINPPSYLIYPGEVFTIPAALYGDMKGLVSYPLRAELDQTPTGTNTRLGNQQNVQSSSNTNCTNFAYSILTNIVSDDLTLILSFGTEHRYVNIHMLHCPAGFILKQVCECAPALNKTGTIICNITDKSIQRKGTTWVGVLEYNSDYDDASIVYSTVCPFFFCNTTDVKISINDFYQDQDSQCSNNRHGHLCGGCKDNYSLALGSNNCLPNCTDNKLSLLIGFAVAGFVLVFFIKLLDITVTRGTVNGLIFYANIVGAHPSLVFSDQAKFIPHRISNFLTTFIAWLNLDLGIETCFIHDMDAYTKAWLQFVFPVYVWMITLLIIALSRYSIRFSRLFGNNSVPVLATLILLSYTKLLRAVISPLSLSMIERLNGTKIAVWEQDGNIRYVSGKHIPLVACALVVLVLLLIPFTFIMVSIQCLYKGSHYRALRWMIRLKPLFDA